MLATPAAMDRALTWRHCACRVLLLWQATEPLDRAMAAVLAASDIALMPGEVQFHDGDWLAG